LQRGFTLAELLTVVAIIGILAAAASPSFVRLMRDRRVSDAAQQMADMYRGARARAMGRGSAIVVRWNAAASMPTQANPAGHLTMREAVLGSGVGALLPSTSCAATSWLDTSATSRYVMAFDERRKRFEPSAAVFQTAQGGTLPYVEICYTPRGRTFIRYTAAGNFLPLASVPRIQVANTTTALRRYIILPPNGVARLVTKI